MTWHTNNKGRWWTEPRSGVDAIIERHNGAYRYEVREDGRRYLSGERQSFGFCQLQADRAVEACLTWKAREAREQGGE